MADDAVPVAIAHVDATVAYEALSLIVRRLCQEPQGGLQAMAALATLLAQVVEGCPEAMRDAIRAEALDIFEQTLRGRGPLLAADRRKETVN